MSELIKQIEEDLEALYIADQKITIQRRVRSAIRRTWEVIAYDCQCLENWRGTSEDIAEMVFDADRIDDYLDEEASDYCDNAEFSELVRLTGEAT